MTLLEQLSEIFGDAFAALGYDRSYGAVTVSGRPELSQFQCNGALAAANRAEPRRNPRQLAEEVVAQLPRRDIFADVSLAGPGFINITLTDETLGAHVATLADDPRLGATTVARPRRVIIDFGGPNAAKSMHVGHLRSSIIGESLQRLFRFRGDEITSDVHLGDWGTQMGQLIAEIGRERPDLPYFDPAFSGPYPETSPVTMEDFARLYPQAAQRFKSDPAAAEQARQVTVEFQNGRPGYVALLRHIVGVSLAALRADFARLGVHFDLWLGEADTAERVGPMIERLLASGVAEESEGALIVPVAEPEDNKEMPPLMLRRSNGGYLYGTTDLATIAQRVADLQPDLILYVVDKRQSLHLEQVFRAARRSGLAGGAALEHLGFGTMNGPDGKPFKTRAGGVMTLEALMDEVVEKALSRLDEIEAAADYDPAERARIAHLVGLAALKFSDLINQPTRDYVFDLERFTAFEGRTGPYLLYTAVRTKSILRKAADQGLAPGAILPAINEHERALMLELSHFGNVVAAAYEDRAPNQLAEYAYNLAIVFNRFYRACHILNEQDAARQASWLGLLQLFLAVLEKGLELLGIETPERM